MAIELIPAYDRSGEIRALFGEYTDMLIAGDPSFRAYLAVQHYDAELEDLEAKYGPPAGRLYLACCDGAPAGCVGLRRMDEGRCEMKRLYVRPAFRGRKLGNLLVERVIADAREIGYAQMLLDTLPFLGSAINLYQKYGFYRIDCYNYNSPMDSSIYMRLDL